MQSRRSFVASVLVLASLMMLLLLGISQSQSQPVRGSYELSFFKSVLGGLERVTSLSVCTPSVCEELILGAHVADSSGLPAQGGAVTFQYCSYKGLPPNDITRADEAPTAACDSGLATWK